MLLRDVTKTFRNTRGSGVHAHERPLLKSSFQGHATADGDAGLAYWQHAVQEAGKQCSPPQELRYSPTKKNMPKLKRQMAHWLMTMAMESGIEDEGIDEYLRSEIDKIIAGWVNLPENLRSVSVSGTRKDGTAYVTTIDLPVTPDFNTFYAYRDEITNLMRRHDIPTDFGHVEAYKKDRKKINKKPMFM